MLNRFTDPWRNHVFSLFSAVLRYNLHITLCKFKVIWYTYYILRWLLYMCIHCIQYMYMCGWEIHMCISWGVRNLVYTSHICCSFYLECCFILCLLGTNLVILKTQFHIISWEASMIFPLGRIRCTSLHSHSIPCLYLWLFIRLHCNGFFICPLLPSEYTCLENGNHHHCTLQACCLSRKIRVLRFASACLDSSVTLGTLCKLPTSVLISNL